MEIEFHAGSLDTNKGVTTVNMLLRHEQISRPKM
jgi:hypothetical protein